VPAIGRRFGGSCHEPCACQRARGHVPGRKSAARLYNNIEYELAFGEPDEPLEDVGERALALLERRFPGVREAALEIEEPPSLSRRACDALRYMSPTGSPRRPARRSNRRDHRRVGCSRRRLVACAGEHPVATITAVAVATIAIVHFWEYIAIAVTGLAAFKASRPR
jgi:hypothetical protein